MGNVGPDPRVQAISDAIRVIPDFPKVGAISSDDGQPGHCRQLQPAAAMHSMPSQGQRLAARVVGLHCLLAY